jgi:hypothetical protein
MYFAVLIINIKVSDFESGDDADLVSNTEEDYIVAVFNGYLSA